MAAGVALVAALVVSAIPAQGAPSTGVTASSDPSATVPTPTDSGTPPVTPPVTPPAPTATPTPTPTVTPDNRLLPDLISLPAWGAYIQARSDGHRLRFSSALGNQGAGPIEVRPNRLHPCPPGQHNSTQVIYRDRNDNGRYDRSRDTNVARKRAGCMVFHPAHDHWHFKASARYQLVDPSRDDHVVVSARRKVSFCLRDSSRLPARYGTWEHPITYGACSRNSAQGISVGWMDIYQSFLAGQSLRLPRNLEPGTYCLRTVVDPIDQLAETDNGNNDSVRALRINGTQVTTRPNRLCREGTR